MLNLILGRAGSGKTYALYEKLKEEVKLGKEAIFLMPEQFSFETEKTIYREMGAKSAQKVKVLSFTRLAYGIFKEYGGIKNQLMPMHKELLMSIALSELEDVLKIYGDYKKSTAFVSTMVKTIDDFKSAGVMDVDLHTTAINCEEEELSKKLDDLSIIYTAYNALMERTGGDPKDNLYYAIEKAQYNQYFKDKVIFIDCFMAFTPAEHRMVNTILEQSINVYGAFCCDSLNDNFDGMGVFSPVNKTITKLISHCKKMNVNVSKPTILNSQYRFNNSDLINIEEQFWSEHIKNLSESDNIKLLMASNPYNEILYIAGEIKKLVVEKNYRFNQIAVITRELTRYEGILPRIFEKYNIPFYMDMRVDIYTTPLIMGVKSILDCVINNVSTQYLLKFAKSPMCKLTTLETAKLDNYSYTWSIKGDKWLDDFTGNPQGMNENFTDEDKRLLEEINKYRKIVVEPILKFKDEIKDADGKTFAKCLFELIVLLEPQERIMELYEFLPLEERARFINLQGQVWDSFIEILDVFAQIIDDRKMSLTQYNDLFEICLANCDVGQIPQTLDHVIIGKADRIRPDKMKATFVIGCVDGEFPANITENGILTSTERKKINDLGVELTANIEERSSYENHYAYFAVTRASDLLYVTYPEADLRGIALEKSKIIEEISEITNNEILKFTKYNKDNLVWNKNTALEQYAEVYDENSKFKSTLEKYLEDNDNAKKLKKAILPNIHMIEDKTLTYKLFGNDMVISPSKIENFYNCKFNYFANNALKIRPRRKVEMSPIESGLIIHYIMEKMVSKYGKELSQQTTENLKKEVKELLTQYVRDRVEIKNLDARLKYLFDRLTDTLIIILEHLGRELEQSIFIPKYFEEPINKNTHFKPMTLLADDGSKITIEGYIDRIDIMDYNGCECVRVIDYKSGTKKFKLEDISLGINMQMLIYLFTICPECTNNAKLKPAGILYMPSKNKIITVKNKEATQNIKDEKDKTLKMNGLVLANETVIYGMEHSGNGIFIPAKISEKKKDKKNTEDETEIELQIDTKSSAISMEEMKRLQEMVKKNITQMSMILHDGNVEAKPSKIKQNCPCDYCPYKIACGYQNEIIFEDEDIQQGGDNNE